MPRVSEIHPPAAEGISRAGWKIVLLASLGGTLEFYDFVVFGVFARDIAEAIFPNTTAIVSLIASFGAFAAGYLARPIGGLVLSHYGDRYGRRTVFLLSLFVMSAATLGMGLVPSYASWGAWASVTMVGLRLVQGFCIGGELPGALTYVVETAPRHAPFVCGLVFACVTLGVAVASGVSLGVRTWLPPELVPVYGWRIAFVLGGLAGLLSVLMRRAMEESPEFARMKALASRRPFGEVLQTHRAAVLAGIGGLAATGGFNGLFFALMPAYLSGVLQYSPRDAVIAQTIGVIVHAAAILGVGRLADRLSPRLMIGIGAGLLIVLAYPFYDALAARTVGLVPAMLMAALVAGLVNGTFAVLLTDLFPTRIRFTGVALVFNVAFTLFSGTAPLVATALIRNTGTSTAPALVMIGCGVLTLLAAVVLRRLGGNVLGSPTRQRLGDPRTAASG
jgi:MFS transporter, MHS family, proline/betaine transporter